MSCSGGATPLLLDVADDSGVTPVNTPYTADWMSNDHLFDAKLSTWTQPAHGTVTLTPAGAFTYTPATDYRGLDTFAYTVCDGYTGEGTTCETATVTMLVGGPLAEDDEDATITGQSIGGTVASNDELHGDGAFALTSPASVAGGALTLSPDGTYDFVPAAGFSGTVAFDYQVCMSAPFAGQCAPATLTIVVTPVGADDTATTDAGEPVAIPVLPNDPSGAGLTVQSTTEPGHGTAVVDPDGTITYTPDDGFSGTDTFTYTACDSEEQCVTQTVTVTVAPAAVIPPPAPSGEDGLASTGGGNPAPTLLVAIGLLTAGAAAFGLRRRGGRDDAR